MVQAIVNYDKAEYLAPESIQGRNDNFLRMTEKNHTVLTRNLQYSFQKINFVKAL